MTSWAKRLRSRVISFFALLNVLSHYVVVAGIARVFDEYYESVGYSFLDSFHHEIKSRFLMSEIGTGSFLI
jgi:hypothetical protein